MIIVAVSGVRPCAHVGMLSRGLACMITEAVSFHFQPTIQTNPCRELSPCRL
ncbi:hypothetical protein C8R31_103430 [Nitrosospira sp. Nsp2]|nr:hypothetical protein C8R31_103430 [Nitrosospira sp. Nsp2]